MKALVILALFWSFFPASAVTLEEAYKAALGRSEWVRISEQVAIGAHERFVASRGGVFPQLSASVGHLIQPQLDPAYSQFSPANQTTVQLTVNQAVFRGLREVFGLSQLQATRSAKQALKHQSEITLFQIVAEAFLGVLSLEQDLRNLQEQSEIYETRAKEIKARQGRGESSRSESLTAQSTAASLAAEIQMVQGQLQAKRESLSFLTGFTNNIPVTDPKALETGKNVPPLAECLKRIGMRWDVKAATEDLDAARQGVSAAWGAHSPSVDAYGNYYLQRPGFLSNLKWDVGIKLSIPIFQGGAIQAQVREAIAIRTGAELALEQLRRQAGQEVRSLYTQVDARMAQIEKLSNAVKLARTNVDVLQKDFKRGLVRNIDVQLALSEARTVIRQRDQSHFSAQLEYFKLQTAAAITPAPMKGNNP